MALYECPGKGYAYIPKGAYFVIAEIHAKRGKRAELRAATLPLISLVRSDPKNLVYFFQEDRENPPHFIFFELFATKKDFEAHNNMPYVKEWFAKLPGSRKAELQQREWKSRQKHTPMVLVSSRDRKPVFRSISDFS